MRDAPALRKHMLGLVDGLIQMPQPHSSHLLSGQSLSVNHVQASELVGGNGAPSSLHVVSALPLHGVCARLRAGRLDV